MKEREGDWEGLTRLKVLVAIARVVTTVIPKMVG